MLKTRRFIELFTFIFLFSAINAYAQTAAFVYQGKLNDGASAANGTYQFEFKLFDAAAGGNQIGQTLSDLPATVTNGIFAVNLDFGASSFTGAPRFLEISVRLNGSGQPYTLLNPRQAVTSTPYAVKSLKANEAATALTSNDSLNLGGIAAQQYVQTTDPRMSDDRAPLPNSTNYIQNTTVQQANSNFSISGEGKADKFTAATQFNIGANRVLSNAGTDNLFAGANAGAANSGINNSFFGTNAGKLNTTGGGNSFFGRNAGFDNTTGANNSFFGTAAGQSNQTGGSNVFLGNAAGLLNTAGSFNVFIGRNTAFSNTTGNSNTFIGFNSGGSVTSGGNNVFIGAGAGSTANVFNSIAIGANVKVAASNTAQIGDANTDVVLPGDVQVGKTLTVSTGNLTVSTGDINVSGGKITALSGSVTGTFTGATLEGSQLIATQFLVNNFSVLNGTTNIQHLKLLENDAGGETDVLCIDEDTNFVKRCLAFLTSRQAGTADFRGGLETIKNLRPVTFNDPVSNRPNVGLTFSSETNLSAPFFSRGKNGASGVRYFSVITALVGAAQEQQTQLERQQDEIKSLQTQIDALKTLLCAANQEAAVCRTK